MTHFSAVTRRKLLTLSGAIAASAGIDGVFGQSAVSPSTGVPVPASEALQTTGVLYSAPPGPWGSLQYYYFYLEAPPHLIEGFPPPNPRTRWAVPIEEEETFNALLDDLFMSPEAKAVLADPTNTAISDGVYVFFPPPSVNIELDSSSRGRLYEYLGRFDANPEIQDPIRIFSGSVDEWARGTGIRPELIALMKSMTYTRNGLMNFADVSFLVSQAKSKEEAQALQLHSSRIRTMIVRLDLKNLGYMAALMEYWTTGLGLRRKQIEPLIDSGIETPGVAGLDLVHLLPPLARKLLYTYPDLSMVVEGKLPDCHWTALNFFNYNPQPIYLEELFAASGLLTDFEMIEPDYKFGDLLVFVTSEMNAFHSCVYVAADIVYTKNGRSLFAPWITLHLSDVMKLYSDADGSPLKIQGFRSKKPVS